MEPILPPSPGDALTGEQSRRLECLRAVLDLFSGRGVPWSAICRIAEWAYSGEDMSHDR